MADFSGGKYAELSSLALVSNCYIRIYMGANWVVTNSGVIINNFNEGGASEAAQGSSSSTVFGSGDVLTIGIDGSTNDDWNATSLQTGSYGFFRVFGDFVTNQAFRLFADENGANGQPQNVTLVEVRNSSNSTLIHSFDLSNPTSATVSDSVGSGVLTLVGFAFGPSFTINEASAAYGDPITFSHSGFSGPLTTWTYEDSQGNVVNLINGTEVGANFPALAADALRGLTGTVTVTIGDGTDTATDTITLTAPTGYTVQSVLAGFSTTPPSVYQGFSGTVQEGEQSLYVTAEWTSFDGLGGGAVDTAGTYTVYHVSLDGQMQSYNITFGPSLDDVGGNDTVVVGDTEAVTYSSFTTAIETATINDAGTASTSLTVSSAGATSANIQLASLSAWVNTKACPFSSTNQTSQQVTVTNTDEAESASRAVTFNPPSGYTVIETNSMTWPAPDGSILKGFASQPPANSQVIHPDGLTVAATGIVTTDLTSNQTCYFYNETTEEGSSFQFLIESAVSNSNNSVDSPVRDTIRSIVRNPAR